ncbi:MAG: polyprenyl synthetase family protein [Prevotellaceae bacterium]|nr:polyprenyl synthetase family protein [Prevotellaceae bacterium]
MRPILVLLAAKYAGEVNGSVLNAAVALELLHTASLVHDDVIDESDQRRGQQSVNALFGNKVAVLVGDFLFSRSLTHACLSGCPEFFDWLACLGQTLSDGELRQLARTESTDFSEEAYYEVIEKKTASLFSLCSKAGAHLAGGSVVDVHTMELFGKYVGICFQLKDDIFDYDTANLTGKPTGNDMKEGKLTLPVIHSLLTERTPELRSLALKVRQRIASDSEVSRLVSFTKESGGLQYAASAIADFSQKAAQLLSPVKDSSVLASLRQYVDFVAQRSM